MKYGISSILITLAGIFFLSYYGFNFSEKLKNQITTNLMSGYKNDLIRIPLYLDFIVYLIVLISLFLSFKAIKTKNNLGYLGILLAVAFAYINYSYFFINLFLSDSAMDINFVR